MSEISVHNSVNGNLSGQIEEQIARLEAFREIAESIRDEELARTPKATSVEELTTELDLLRKMYADSDFDSVCARCCDLIEAGKDNVDVYNFLGAAWKELGRYELAETAYIAALMLEPANGCVRSNLGVALSKLNRDEEALVQYDLALSVEPDEAVITYNRANTLKNLGRIPEAVEGLWAAIHLNPTLAPAWTNLGGILIGTENFEAATAALETACDVDPENLEAIHNLGRCKLLESKFGDALGLADKALEKSPSHAASLILRASADAGINFQPSINLFQKSVKLNPDDHDSHSSLCFFSCYDNAETREQQFSYHKAFGEQFAKTAVAPKPEQLSLANNKLRIGYVSPDFNTHSVAYFLEPLLRNHDKDKFEIFCYYNQSRVDQTTERMMHHADHWRSIVGLSDQSFVDLVQNDGIHILVDLAGHTHKNNLTAFAYKPAPIQVSWLGYPNTTGLTAIDYRLTDDIADPVGDSEQFHTETLVRLPQGMWCYGGDTSIKPHTDLPYDKNGYITFGSFNNLAKMTPEIVKLWAEILTATPNAKLLLKAKQLVEEETQERLLKLFEDQGISRDRLVLKAFIASKEHHFNLYGEVDLALDTFPFNGATTTCEAVWMGVPVLTLRGDRHVARVGASMMHRIGLDELVAQDKQAYVAKATEYAQNTDALRNLRIGMRERVQTSPLYDAKAFATSIEQKFSEMWQEDF